MAKTRVTLVGSRGIQSRWNRAQDPYLFTGTVASNVGLNNESVKLRRFKKVSLLKWAEVISHESDKGLNYGQRKGMDFSSGAFN